MIHLGYETGTGKPVDIPLAHMAVTGQTQQSGKTTTLEALIDRGDLRAVVFITKPGEKSFSEGRRILPFFKERADWEYVKELLESRRNESLSKWDGYLMRVCRRARTLEDVRNNVECELPKKKSARPSHYEVLAGYLDLIIPELRRVPYSDKLDLRRGVNVMDLTGMSEDMQNMVLRSTIEHIHKDERGAVLVLPEAWKFIPEGGRSSVFQALHALIREGATNGNFVWIDAQDLAIVSKRILKSVTVWVLGKQQEANEVARTINHLIEPLHIRPDMIKSLGIGQFLVCGEGITKRVYVQPRWLGELDALAIARGEESVETAQAIWRQKVKDSKRQGSRENVETKKPVGQPAAVAPADHQEANRIAGTGIEDGNVSGGTDSGAADQGEDESMWKEKYEALETEHEALIEAHDALAKRVGMLEVMVPPKFIRRAESNSDFLKNPSLRTAVEQGILTGETAWERSRSDLRMQCHGYALDGELCALPDGHTGTHSNVGPFRNAGVVHTAPVTANGAGKPLSIDNLEDIYDWIKNRASGDPGILQLLAQRPELRVTIEAPVLEVDGKTLRGALALLLHKKFFETPRNGNTTFNELQRLGRKTAKPNVYRELDNLAELGFLTKEPGGGYQSTDLKVTVAK